MRRHILVSTGAVLLTGALLAGCGNDDAEEPDTAGAVAEEAADGDAQPAAQEITPEVAADLAAMRAATAEYVTDVNAALDAGFEQLTSLVDGVGSQYLNASVPEGYDPSQPQLLVYSGDEAESQLAAVGWIFTEAPAEPPLEGATFGELPAACHYDDGSFVEEADEAACAESDPATGAAFTFWHPDLTTLHAWAWMPNPDGVFASTNPLLSPGSEAPASPTASAAPSEAATSEPTESAPPTEDYGD
jgi:hypothetical protein